MTLRKWKEIAAHRDREGWPANAGSRFTSLTKQHFSVKGPHSGDRGVTASDSVRGCRLLKGQRDSKAFGCLDLALAEAKETPRAGAGGAGTPSGPEKEP